jgi:hypothetical protein
MVLRRAAVYSVFVTSALTLASCGYTVNKSHQDISFETPGAENATCDVYVDKLRYQVMPPQKVNIMKSENDMEIKCIAPGNRMKTLTVPAKFSYRTVWGTPAGMAWDYASESMYYYPSVIAIDFSQEATKPNPPPRHNNPDIVQPEEYDLEEYLPGEPRLNSDRYRTQDPIRRRDDVQREWEEIDEKPIGAAPAPVRDDKGNLKSVLQRVAPKAAPANVTPLPEAALEDSMAPKMPAANTTATVPAASKPIPLFPGE